MIKSIFQIAGVLLAVYACLVVLVYFRQRAMLFYPTHYPVRSGVLAPWTDNGRVIGFSREVPAPLTIWLMMHGNAGQAADRDYVLHRMSMNDSLYILEYPGYGSRKGAPSMDAINRAASEAYRILRSRYPDHPVGVIGESIGSGPACALAREAVPPDKIVLVVPFDTLANVAARHFPFFPVRLLLKDAWDNVASLKTYTGPVEIFGALNDTIIPADHARALAAQVPGAQLIIIDSGHNDWPENDRVIIRR
jgi:pimeloyl-ACP methyl ester carboxylesterase